MKQNNLITLLLLISLFIVSCNLQHNEKDNYPKNKNISDSLGITKDSLMLYLPQIIKRDTDLFNTYIDSSNNKGISSLLICSKEPLLYNYYLGKDIYRLIWLNSLNPKPTIITFIKSNNEIWLTTKILDNYPSLFGGKIYRLLKRKFVQDGKTVNEENTYSSTPTKCPGWSANIIFNHSTKLTMIEWNKFIKLLEDGLFWEIKPSKEKIPARIDGATWLIEANTKNQYWFVVKNWNSFDSTSKAATYLLELSKQQ